MYVGDEISLETFRTYNKLVHLYKEKYAESAKLDELKPLLIYFINNYETFNEDEKKLTKNVLIISKGITNNVKNHYKKFQDKLNSCLELIQQLEEKKKELSK